MEKKPIFGRFFLVALIAAWALWQWYPDPLGVDMVEVFRSKLKPEEKAEIIIATLQETQKEKEKKNPPEELTLKDWQAAIGEGVDLRDLLTEKLQQQVFRDGMPVAKSKYDNLSPKEKEKSDTRRRRALKRFNLSINEWDSPDAEALRKINRELLKRIEKEASGKIRLGLDLSGGVQFVAKVQPKKDDEGKDIPVTEEQLSVAIEILRERVDGFGVAEPIIQTAGEDLVIVQVPALSQSDRDKVQELIKKVGKLDFRLSHRDSPSLIKEWRNSGNARVRGAELMEYEQENTAGDKVKFQHFIERKVALSGSHIKHASVQRNPLTQTPEIHFTLDALGATQFAKLTEKHKVGDDDPRLLSIVLDGKLISAPNIQSRIHSRGQITGDFTEAEAQSIASSLNNPLENPLEIIEMRDVDPSLGIDSIKKGLNAGIYGLIAVAVFMLIYYLLSGVMANIALALNILILLGVLCWFDAALTLPGIAGVVLTIGMAVDANTLIYERIREELNVGKSVKGAIKSGYDKAFGTIFDANITTMIASVILIYMGKGPVKGFGITLTIGIITSMFTALVVTRVVMDALVNWGVLGADKTKRYLHLRPAAQLPKFDFLKYAKPAFIISWLLILAGFGYGLSQGKDKMLGVDFAGGNSLLMKIGKTDQTEKIETAIANGALRQNLAAKTGIEAAKFQIEIRRSNQLATDEEKQEPKLQVNFPIAPEGEDYAVVVEQTLKEEIYPEAELTRDKLDKVGPTVSGEIQKSAGIAVLLALFGILIYVAFRYEYAFAIGAVIAILHDVAMTGGWFFLTGRELNAPIVAAALTIIGFSINDTIVIFDRIRENLRMGTAGSFEDVMNHALNQTLSRTIITSGTTLLSTATLYFFGGTVINDFAFTFLVGVITGTYSSIYIACAIVLWWHKGKKPELSMSAVTTEAAKATT